MSYEVEDLREWAVERINVAARALTLRWRRRKAASTVPGDEHVLLGPGVEAWRCHVCGALRPDEVISVATYKYDLRTGEPRPLAKRDDPDVVRMNVRYCNDKPLHLKATQAIADRWVRGWLRGVE